jgi:predicted nucleic acid-binding protein
MSEALERVVFDCNVFAGGLINPFRSAGECIKRVLDGELKLFWSNFVIAEIRWPNSQNSKSLTPRSSWRCFEKLEVMTNKRMQEKEWSIDESWRSQGNQGG